MKTILLTFALIAVSNFVSGQDWKTQYVTATGDTFRIGNKLQLEETKRYKYVKPSKYFVTRDLIEKQPISSSRYTAYFNYLHTFLKGSVHEIVRFSRIPDKKQYKHVAFFIIQDNTLSQYPVEYQVEIEAALNQKEITLVH